MVYRGKPSAACGECRKRRSRCDQALPTCGQCTKAGRTCPGYRNATDLMFHDESTRIIHKNKGCAPPNAKSSDARSVGISGSKEANGQAATASPIKLIDFVMYQPLDDLGVNFFMSHYIGDDPAVSQLYYLPAFYAQTGYANAGLQHSITAAGLAGYAKSARRKEMIDLATKSYVAAIRGINTALSDPRTAAQDSTLMSIIMAAMFEVLIIPRDSGMQNCSKHLDGAVSVASLHLKQGRLTNVTRKLLTTLIQSVILHSWIQHRPLPPGFVELKKQVGEKINPHSVHGTFLDIVMELVQFRHALRDGMYDSPMAIIRKALDIDNSLSEFATNMPRHARFESFRVSSDAAKHLAYEGYYHVYPQRFTAHLWNNVRSSRLCLHQLVLRQCHLLMPSSTPDEYHFMSAQQLQSEASICTMAMEITATVPHLAGYVEQLEVHQTPAERSLSGPSITSSIPRPGEPHLAKDVVAADIELSSHMVYDPGPFQKHASLTPPPTSSPCPSSSSSSSEHEPELGAPPLLTATQILPATGQRPAVGRPQPASLYHMLSHLHALRSIPHLHVSMKEWIQGRIEWLESTADPHDLSRLRDMLRKRPKDGFSVNNAENHIASSSNLVQTITR